jgi:hypothetical protein
MQWPGYAAATVTSVKLVYIGAVFEVVRPPWVDDLNGKA